MLYCSYGTGITGAPDTGGWTAVNAGIDNNNAALRVHYKVAVSGDLGSNPGVSGSTSTAIIVFSGTHATDPVGANVNNSGNSSTITYSALTLEDTSGVSWVFTTAHHERPQSGFSTPTGMTERWDFTDGNPGFQGCHIGPVSSFTSRTSTVTRSQQWVSTSIEILASTGTTFNETPTDNEGLTDTIAVDQSLARTDNENLTDTAAIEQSLSRTDNLGLTDQTTVASDFPRSFTDNLGLTDSFTAFREVTRDFTDNLGLSDTFQVELTLTFNATDNLGLTDTIALQRFLDRLDTLDVTETVQLSFERALPVENIGITDVVSVAKDTAMSFTDALGVTDAIAMAFNWSRTDNLEITDSVAKEQSQTAQDNLGITDTIEVVIPLKVEPLDTMGLSDTVVVEEFEAPVKESFMSLVDDKREIAITYLVANLVDTEDNLRRLSIHDLAHKYWSHRASALDNQARSILDHMDTTNPDNDGWEWLTQIVAVP